MHSIVKYLLTLSFVLVVVNGHAVKHECPFTLNNTVKYLLTLSQVLVIFNQRDVQLISVLDNA